LSRVFLLHDFNLARGSYRGISVFCQRRSTRLETTSEVRNREGR
jgi:hypothetical protein